MEEERKKMGRPKKKTKYPKRAQTTLYCSDEAYAFLVARAKRKKCKTVSEMIMYDYCRKENFYER